MFIDRRWNAVPFTGVLYGHNDTNDGVYTVFTGEHDISKLGIINKWNYSR